MKIPNPIIEALGITAQRNVSAEVKAAIDSAYAGQGDRAKFKEILQQLTDADDLETLAKEVGVKYSKSISRKKFLESLNDIHEDGMQRANKSSAIRKLHGQE